MLRRNFLKAAAGFVAGLGATLSGRTLSLAKGEPAIPEQDKPQTSEWRCESMVTDRYGHILKLERLIDGQWVDVLPKA